MLKPLAERKVSADQVIARLRGRVAVVPGAPAFFQAVQDVRAGGRMGNAQYQYTLQGDDVRELDAWGPRVAERLRALPQLVDLSSDQQDKGRQSSLVIDRATASRLGITPQLIDDTLYDAFGQRQVAIMYTPLNQYHVVMEVEPRFWQRPETLQDIYLPSAKGGMVPLSAFSRYEPTRTALAVNHQAQFPSVTLSFNLAPGVALGDAVRAIEAAVRPLGLPAGIQGSFQGTAQVFQASLASQPCADRGRAARGVRRPRRALRELHPPAHHPVHAAVGRGGRAAGPAGLPHRPDRHRAHRHPAPGRHREEERDHDDRLRPGGRATERARARRRRSTRRACCASGRS